MNTNIQELVKSVVSNYATENQISQLRNPDLETTLYGKDSLIDSIGLVTIIVEIEQRVLDQYSKKITLADEKAMSLQNSPFKNIKSISEYIETLIN